MAPEEVYCYLRSKESEPITLDHCNLVQQVLLVEQRVASCDAEGPTFRTALNNE